MKPIRRHIVLSEDGERQTAHCILQL